MGLDPSRKAQRSDKGGGRKRNSSVGEGEPEFLKLSVRPGRKRAEVYALPKMSKKSQPGEEKAKPTLSDQVGTPRKTVEKRGVSDFKSIFLPQPFTGGEKRAQRKGRKELRRIHSYLKGKEKRKKAGNPM